MALITALSFVACYSIGCLRLTYFKEWKFDADVKNVYSVLDAYSRTHNLANVSVNWRYDAALNAYREMSGSATLRWIDTPDPAGGPYQDGYQAYVVFYPKDEDFIKREGLKIVYHNEFTDATVVVRRELESATTLGAPVHP